MDGNAVGIRAGAIGWSRNQVTNVTVRDNILVGSRSAAIDVGAGDANSDWNGMPGPISYSDNNVIEHLMITSNVIEDVHMGIDVYAANLGNRYNQVRDVHIIGNTLRRIDHVGIYLAASGEGCRHRSTSYNVMEEVEVSHNTLSDVRFGVWVFTGDFRREGDPNAAEMSDNRLTGLTMAGNTIENYESGISVWGGIGNASRNVLEQLTLTGNQILDPKPDADTTGLALVGGESHEGQGPAEGNAIRGVTLSGNTVQSHHVGISLVGGQGAGARGNSVIVAAMTGNDLRGSLEPLQVISNSEGAIDNRVTILGGSQVHLPIILRR